MNERLSESFKRVIDAGEFALMLAVSKRTLSRLRAQKALPAPVRIGRKTIRWRLRDVEDYIDKLPTVR